MAEQAAHAVPLLKLPSGQTVPDAVFDWTASHFVRSFASWVNPLLQVTQIPLLSSHWLHPSWHTEQSPFESRKKPGAHLAHAVPLSAVVQPALQVRCPFEPHSPFKQLQVDGRLLTIDTRHRPDPEMPSSQDEQPPGHA